MQIQNDAVARLILWNEPRTLEHIEGMLLRCDILPARRRHQLPELILPASCRLERGAGEKRLKKLQLGLYKFRGKRHGGAPFNKVLD